jgi:hypothetical protein
MLGTWLMRQRRVALARSNMHRSWAALRPDFERSRQIRLRGERLIRVSLAGPIAQRRFNPRSWREYHGQHDHDKALDMVCYYAQYPEHAQAYMRVLEIEARQLVDRNWALRTNS